MISKLKRALVDNLKNIPGWKTRRKIVVFSIDDYGNIRLDSRQARENLQQAGVPLNGRFDAYDTLGTRQDLSMLFDVLSSVKDTHGRSAVFTPYALPCNIHFEEALKQGRYVYETLPETYSKLAAEQPEAYEGAWDLWYEGIRAGFMKPQFHGREHLNIDLFNRKLSRKDEDIMANLQNRSYAGIQKDKEWPTVGFTHAFSFWKEEQVSGHKAILEDGLNRFEEVFGFPTTVFTPPAQQLHPKLYTYLEQSGVQAIDKPLLANRHTGEGNFKKEFNKTGRKKGQGHVTLVRNVVFEPNNGNADHVGKALSQIEAAFRWNKPANISSHRVNFCGHIDPRNREKGLGDLKELLNRITKKWPDAEFLSADELAKLIEKN
ncbi:MAG: hypothetical protein JJU28_00205 [Cyclobacteriaceae bacterium]|nr:hypothetical protein [Cyclobacteriaceae bacterium]